MRQARRSRRTGIAIVLCGALLIAAPAAHARPSDPASRAAPVSDRGWIAYSIKTGIHVIRSDGTGQRVLIPWRTRSCGRGCTIWLVPRHPRWSPNGRRVTYFVESYTVRKYTDEDENARAVWVADADGSDRRRLGLGYNPDWSPDGTEVVYMRNDALPGYGPMRAVNLRTRATRTWPVQGAPEFSPDGQRMLHFTPPDPKATTNREPGNVTVAGLDGSAARRVTARTFYDYPPRWTTDGWISYNCVGGAQPDICLIDPDTRRRQRLTRSQKFWDLYAAPSPSGRFFAVGGLNGLYVTTRAGKMRRVLVRNGSGINYVPSNAVNEPDWQPRP